MKVAITKKGVKLGVFLVPKGLLEMVTVKEKLQDLEADSSIIRTVTSLIRYLNSNESTRIGLATLLPEYVRPNGEVELSTDDVKVALGNLLEVTTISNLWDIIALAGGLKPVPDFRKYLPFDPDDFIAGSSDEKDVVELLDNKTVKSNSTRKISFKGL